MPMLGVELGKVDGQLLTCEARFHSVKNNTKQHDKSPIMITTITLERLRKRGYISLLEIYISLNPSVREPLST
jgi:hypothetical protein